VRVFDDGGCRANLWFELEPNRFWCGDNQPDAEDTRRMLPRLGQTEERLHTMFSALTKGKV
jgi:hypothetical protein